MKLYDILSIMYDNYIFLMLICIVNKINKKIYKIFFFFFCKGKKVGI